MKDIAYEVAIKPRHDAYQRRLKSVVYKLFDKKMESRATWKLKANVNEMLANKASKERKKLYASFKINIWAADLGEMGSLSSKNRSVKYLLCVIDIFTKYSWIKL